MVRRLPASFGGPTWLMLDAILSVHLPSEIGRLISYAGLLNKGSHFREGIAYVLSEEKQKNICETRTSKLSVTLPNDFYEFSSDSPESLPKIEELRSIAHPHTAFCPNRLHPNLATCETSLESSLRQRVAGVEVHQTRGMGGDRKLDGSKVPSQLHRRVVGMDLKDVWISQNRSA